MPPIVPEQPYGSPCARFRRWTHTKMFRKNADVSSVITTGEIETAPYPGQVR